jgi:hypothetical protein
MKNQSLVKIKAKMKLTDHPSNLRSIASLLVAVNVSFTFKDGAIFTEENFMEHNKWLMNDVILPDLPNCKVKIMFPE